MPPGELPRGRRRGKAGSGEGGEGLGSRFSSCPASRPASPADLPPAGHTPPRVAPPGLWLLLMAPPRGLGRHPPPWFSWDLGVESPFAVFRSPGRFSPLPPPAPPFGASLFRLVEPGLWRAARLLCGTSPVPARAVTSV